MIFVNSTARFVGTPGSAHGPDIGIDTSERGVGYVYRAHSAVEHTTKVSTTGQTNTAADTPRGAYSYSRDTAIITGLPIRLTLR